MICWKKLSKFFEKLFEILENFEKIWENFEQILKKFFEISLFAYSFQINFSNHYVSGKNWGGGCVCVPPKIQQVKFWGAAPLPPPPPPTNRLLELVTLPKTAHRTECIVRVTRRARRSPSAGVSDFRNNYLHICEIRKYCALWICHKINGIIEINRDNHCQ